MKYKKISEMIPDLSNMGNVVPEGYEFFKKKITPGTLLNLPEASFKWYNLYPPDKEISYKQVNEARCFIESEIKSGTLKLENELGFIILHSAGEYLLLLITTWRRTNEMWESIYFKKVALPENYQPIKFETDHKGTYCVWELGIVWHERNAWVRFIESKRDQKAKLEYLTDTFSGML